ncbi:hypothetical protein BX616_003282, partial [Lobosporangium transversale]
QAKGILKPFKLQASPPHLESTTVSPVARSVLLFDSNKLSWIDSNDVNGSIRVLNGSSIEWFE